MNSLSWFLYLAGALDNLQTVLGITAAALLVVIAVRLFAVGTHNDNCCNTREPKKDYPAPLPYVGGAFILLIIVALIPNKNTMYAIAASEVGERIVKSETVQGISSDATKALHQWIKSKLRAENQGKDK